jgi:hypothetical protein
MKRPDPVMLFLTCLAVIAVLVALWGEFMVTIEWVARWFANHSQATRLKLGIGLVSGIVFLFLGWLFFEIRRGSLKSAD